MEFSTIGAEDSIDEAKARLESIDVLIVWGQEIIIGVITQSNLEKVGTCGEICELDILVDPSDELIEKWKPKWIILPEDDEPVSIMNHQ